MFSALRNTKRKDICPVCGYPLNYPADDFNICPSCGVEFGYQDAGRSIESLREDWLLAGARWSSNVIKPPKKWDPLLQLKNLEPRSDRHVVYNADFVWSPQPDYSLSPYQVVAKSVA